MFPKNTVSAAIIAATFVSAGCSGGGGSSTPADPAPTESTTLSGTAAAGAPLIGQVTVKGALGNTNSAYIEANGSYDVDVTGLTAPYRLRAQGSVGGRTYKLHSYAEAADVGGTINITPFTDLIIANAAGQLATHFFNSTTTTELSAEDVETQKAALKAKLQNVFDALGLDTAIDLLKTSFRADHSGLDAALDIINISVDESLNQATITNLVEQSFIIDDILDTNDNTETITVTDAAALTTAVSETQQIASIFNNLTSAFANGLPAETAIQAYFADTFRLEDGNKQLFLDGLLSDSGAIGITFGNTSVKNLDTTATPATAQVTFNVGFNGVVDPRPETWHAVKDPVLGWQLDGDQRIVEAYFSFHCNDYDGNGSYPGNCGINASIEDNDFDNNGTGSAEIASATVTIIDGSDGVTEKATIYLGNPSYASPGDLQVYDEGSEFYTGDWKAFGSSAGQINSGVFAEGDTIQYALYTEALDLTNPASPDIATGATPVETYTETLLFEPATQGKYPTATAETLTAMNGFSLGDSLTVAWTLAEGTRTNEVLVKITDTSGNQLEVWAELWGDDSNSVTFASAELDAAAATAVGLDTTSLNELRVRIYAMDPVTGQKHSRDYTASLDISSGGGTSDCDASGITTLQSFTSVMTACSTFTEYTANDLIGNAFEFSTAPGEILSFIDASNGQFSNDGGNSWEAFTWSITAEGFAQIDHTGPGISDWFAITSGTATNGTIAAFTNESGGGVFEETVILWSSGGSSSLVCGYESGWDDVTEMPINPNSFADYETVLADCGAAMSFTAADIAGTEWIEDQGENIFFDDNPGIAATFADPESGRIIDAPGSTPIEFLWYVEAASCTGCTHNYLVIYTDDSIDSNLPVGFSLRETAALTGVTGTLGVSGAIYTFVKYYEESEFGDMVRDTGSDGEIWTHTGNTVQ